MTRIIKVIIPILVSLLGNAQSVKPTIDTSSFFHWPQIRYGNFGFSDLSNDGNYVAYSTGNSSGNINAIKIQSVNNDKQYSLSNIKEVYFSNDSRHTIYLQSKDSLCILNLSTGEKQIVAKIKSFQLFMQGRDEWIAEQFATVNKELILRNLRTGFERKFQNVVSYLLTSGSRYLILQVQTDSNTNSLQLVNLSLENSKGEEIWQGISANSIIADSNSTRIAFIGKDSDNASSSIFLYDVDFKKIKKLVTNGASQLPQGIELGAISNFSRDAQKLFFTIKDKEKPASTTASLTIWSYIDRKLQTRLWRESTFGNRYLAVIDINDTSRLFRLQQKNENVSGNENARTDDYVVLTYNEGEQSENYWNKSSKSISWIVNTTDGKRTRLPFAYPTILSNGKYVIGFGEDERDNSVYSYETATGTIRKILVGVPSIKSKPAYYVAPLKSRIAGCLEGDKLLVYDNYDIWEIDLSGQRKSINLTKGREKDIQFRLIESYPISEKSINPKDLLLQSFNMKTKEAGFYRIEAGRQLKLLFHGDYVFKVVKNKKNLPVKSRDKEMYLVLRESTNESPNLFLTRNFIDFKSVSGIYPERKFKWFTSELVTFATPFGFETQGVLYKPENFDSIRKYPLIIHYYDDEVICMSNKKNEYQHPIARSKGDLDIAWFVNQGYLVLITDIHYKEGEVGPSVCNAVVSAAKYMSTKKWIDESRIGIQGFSFGGYETNYLVTHTNLFAAAVSSSGVCDLAGNYGNLWGTGSSMQEYYETRGFRMGKVTPWTDPKRYVANSPIYFVGSITTPILLVNNRSDLNVPFAQGLEFFLGLRRAGKRAWMLEYDNGGHGVTGEEDYKDYLIRMTQFYDHYLKGKPAPTWMTRGIKGKINVVTDGLELDNEFKTPGPGLLMEEEQGTP